MALISRIISRRSRIFNFSLIKSINLQAISVTKFSSNSFNNSTKGNLKYCNKDNKDYDLDILRKLNIYLYESKNEGEIIASFLRINNVYENNMTDSRYRPELEEFFQSSHFERLLKNVEDKLPEFSVTSSLILCTLHQYDFPRKHLIMKKILYLIMDHLPNCNSFDYIHIYSTMLQMNCEENEDIQIILKVCEKYFDTCFEEDLEYMKYSFELLQVLDMKELPKKVREMIVNKLFDDALQVRYSRKDIHHFIKKLLSHHTLLTRSKWMTLLGKCQEYIFQDTLLNYLLQSYTSLISLDKVYYEPELLSNIVKKIFENHVYSSTVFNNFHYLFLLGHFEPLVISKVVERILVFSFKTNVSKAYAEILTQSSFHEMEEFKPYVESVRKALKSGNYVNSESPISYHYSRCSVLTYLGCDTRSLCVSVLEGMKRFPEEFGEKSLLLFHLARACLGDDFKPLKISELNSCLKGALKLDSQSNAESLIEYFGGKNYLLKNCATTHLHFLHFVAILGEDRKPIDLTKYCKSQHLKVDTMKKPPRSKMVAFQIFPHPYAIKFLNVPKMTGFAKMYLKSFQKLNCDVVLLPPTFFEKSAAEKGEYLDLQINEIFCEPSKLCVD